MNDCCTAAFPAAMCKAHAKTDAEQAAASWAAASTKASAHLEGRDVPADYVRPPEVEAFLAGRLVEVDGCCGQGCCG